MLYSIFEYDIVGHDWSNLAYMRALEKEMATHSSVLAWRIPGTGEPGGLPSMGSHRVGSNWSDLVAAAAEGRWKCMENTHRLEGVHACIQWESVPPMPGAVPKMDTDQERQENSEKEKVGGMQVPLCLK